MSISDSQASMSRMKRYTKSSHDGRKDGSRAVQAKYRVGNTYTNHRVQWGRREASEMARAHVGEDVGHSVRLHLPRLEVEPAEAGLSLLAHVREDVVARAMTTFARLRARA